MYIKKSEILDTGLDNKVLVKWTENYIVDGEIEDTEIEYSIHTLGANHTDENHNLVWGHYYNNLKQAKRVFNYYKEEHRENIDNLIKNVQNTIDAWIDDDTCWMEHTENLEFLSICNGNPDEVWTFQGDSYRELEKEYKNTGIIQEKFHFGDYVIYASQSW